MSGSIIDMTRAMVSWEGMPFLNGQYFFNQSSLVLPNSSMSTQPSAFESRAVTTKNKMSSKSCFKLISFLGSVMMLNDAKSGFKCHRIVLIFDIL